MDDEALRAGLLEMGAATLYEAAGRRGALDGAIGPLAGPAAIAGRAATAVCHPGDNLAVHRAVARLEPGSILVVDGRGVQVGYLGDILATGARVRGALGAVVDGGVRDLAVIRSLGFGLWARGAAIAGAAKTTPGEIDGPVSCGGVVIHPGDWIVADADGVVALAAEPIAGVLERARARTAAELDVVARLERGETTMETFALRED